MRLPYTNARGHRRSPRRRATAALTTVFLACALALGCWGGGSPRLKLQKGWVASHPNAPLQVKQAVLGKKIQEGIGMPPSAVVASWGEPDEKLDLGGGDAAWIYRKRQDRNSGRIVIEYKLIFNRGFLMRVQQMERR